MTTTIDKSSQLASLFSESARQKFARNYVNPSLVDVSDEKEQNSASNDEAEDTAKSDEDSEKRTIFVGNVPISETSKSLHRIFSEYGPIESVRIRSLPVAGIKVDDAGNQRLVKKVCANQGKLGEQKGSFNAYIKFQAEESAQAALIANNLVLGEPKRHLRVDLAQPSLFDPTQTIFIGNVPYYADEEELREFFAKVNLSSTCLPF
jgi:nucleolar protein 12